MARLKKMMRWIALLVTTVIGHVAGMLSAFPSDGPSFGMTPADFLMAPLLLLTATACAATGPLCIVCFALYTFRVRGGTPIALFSFLLTVPVMYLLLTLWMRNWAKMERPAAKWASYIGMVCYSALSTYCIMYVSQRM